MGRGGDSSLHRPVFYYGWVIAGTLAITETVSWGILFYSFAVMMPQMEAEFGWTRAETSGAFSLALLISGLAAIFVGRWLDRHGARVLMTVGSVLGVVLMAAWSQIQTLTHLYLVWAGIGLIMAAVLYEPAFAVIARWFDAKRRQALTLLTLCAGFASTIFIPLTQWLIGEVGWRGALMVLAGVLGVITVPLHAILLRRSPSDLGFQVDGAAHQSEVDAFVRAPNVSVKVALRHMTFWSLVAALVFNTFTSAVLVVHLISYLIENGFDATFAAGIAGFIGGMQVPGRVLFSVFGAKVPRTVVTVAVFAMQVIAYIMPIQAHSTLGILLFGVLLGMSSGMATLLRATLIADYFGAAHYGKLNGVVGLFTSSTRGIAPIAAGLLYVRFGGYAPVLWLLVVFSVLATVFAFIAERTSGSLVRQPDPAS